MSDYLPQLSVWTEHIHSICGAFETKFNFHPSLFIGDVSSYRLGNTEVAFIRSNATDIFRKKGNGDRAEDRICFLIYQPKGNMIIYQDNQKIELNNGDIALLDTAKTIKMIPDGIFEHISIHLSREKLFFSGIMEQHFGRINTHNFSGHLLKKMMQNIGHDSINLWCSESDGYAIEDALIALLQPLVYYQSQQPNYSIKSTAEQFINDHIHCSDLNPKLISNALGISTRQLYRLFSDGNLSISRYIQNLRLQQIERDLLNQNYQNISITDIALKWGFEDISHFSKCFKKYYGVSPRDFRLNIKNKLF